MDPKLFKRFRQRYGITHKRLAHDLGINESTLFRWETGKTNPPGKLVVLALQTVAKHYRGIEAAIRSPLAAFDDTPPPQESHQTPQDQETTGNPYLDTFNQKRRN